MLSKEGIPNNITVYIGFLLSKAAQKIKSNADEELETYNISSQHFGVLIYLNQIENVSQIDIANALLIDRTTMVKIIDQLENENYVQRLKNPTDRRKYNIVISNEGKQLLAKVEKRIKEIEQEFLSPLSKDEVNNLISNLKKLITE